MNDSKRKYLGRYGENMAAVYLEKQGYVIKERNYRCACGEIDIVAKDGKTFAFIEVRTRRSLDYGTPEESITVQKKGRMIKTALTYVNSHRISKADWRIDLLAIELDKDGRTNRIELIKNMID